MVVEFLDHCLQTLNLSIILRQAGLRVTLRLRGDILLPPTQDRPKDLIERGLDVGAGPLRCEA